MNSTPLKPMISQDTLRRLISVRRIEHGEIILVIANKRVVKIELKEYKTKPSDIG